MPLRLKTRVRFPAILRNNMKRSLQEVVELVVFGLIALVVATGLLWVFGQVIVWVGVLFKLLAL